MEMEVDTVKVATWNISTNKNWPLIANIASEGAQIICLQEVNNAIIDTLNLVKIDNNKFYEGQTKIGREKWNVLFWENIYTANGTMGLAIVCHPDYPFKAAGVYDYRAIVLSNSERRGLPWVQLENNTKIYSYHSTSSGDNTAHRDNVNREMEALLDMSKACVLGDFNMDKDYYLQDFTDKLRMVAPNDATRISSGRRLDYCVHTSNLNIDLINVLPLGGSDHQPVLFEITL